MSNFFTLAAIIGIISVFLQIFFNRVSSLSDAFHKQFGNDEIEDKHFKFFARRLSDLPLFFANLVLRSLLKRFGVYCWEEGLAVFKKEHASIATYRRPFKKKGL